MFNQGHGVGGHAGAVAGEAQVLLGGATAPLQPRKSEQAAMERAWFTDWTARIFLRLRRAVLASIAHMPTPERILLTRKGTFIRS